MGKFKMGNDKQLEPKQHVKKQKVPKEVIKYEDSSKDLNKVYSTIGSESHKLLKKTELNAAKIQDLQEVLVGKINNLGESAADSFDKAIKRMEFHEDVINKHAALLVTLRHERNKNEKKRKRILRRLIKTERSLKKADTHIKLYKIGFVACLVINLITLFIK